MKRPDLWMLGISAAILLAIAGLSYRDWSEYRRASTDALRTQQILISMQRLLSTTLDAETGQRGFLLTGDERYLAPYYSAIQAVSSERATLKGLMTRPRDEPGEIARLSKLVDQKLEELHTTIEVRRIEGFQAALDTVLSDRGKQIMDEIRDICGRIQSREYSALIDGTLRIESLARRTEVVAVAGMLTLFAFLVAASLATNRAIVRRERSLREVREARDVLKTTLASIGDAVISTDRQGRVVFANGVALELLRRKESDVVGAPLQEVFQIVNEFTRQPVESPVTRVLREGTVVGLANHTVLIAADGTETPIDDSGAPIRDKNGNIHGTVLVFRNITERRRADAAIRLLASIVESSDDAIISKSMDGIVTSWNKGAERIFGYTPEEMVGQSILAIAAPDRADEMPQILERIRRGERIDHYQTVRRGKRGNLIHVSLSVSPVLDSAGRIVGASKIARDVTDRVVAEQSILRNADRLARSNADLQQFTYAASHDLQEPLRTIVTFTQMLAERYQGKMDAQTTQYVEFIISAATRMSALISDLLNYSRLSQHDDAPFKEVPLSDIVNWAAYNLQMAIQDSGATLDAGPLPSVWANQTQMIQLFQNLLSNAIKYRSQDAPSIRIGAEQKGEEWIVSVCDNGVGVAPEYREYIFGVFKRLHGQQFPGTGVGLAICKGIVERHGGRIWVESAEGQGSIFRFSIPAKKDQQPPEVFNPAHT
ncbi:MAG TPA: PAS domain S-box protein [Bryobacteraceae bacterium]|nr:PAS domain S-box protein [Bryobacteraceae bacterium]